MSPTRALLACAALILALVVAASFLSERGCRAKQPSAGIDPPAPDDAATPRVAVPSVAKPAGCVRHARRDCDGGDGWWFDSCGRREELIEQCDDSWCRDGRCAPLTGPKCPADLSERGFCDGEVLHYCVHGVARVVDCAAHLGETCVLDDDGQPACLPKRSCALGNQCRGNSYFLCDRGFQRFGICPAGSICQMAGEVPRCVGPAARFCERPQLEASSDQETDLPVVAFLVADAGGHTAESEERARNAVLAASATLSQQGHDTGIRIDLRDVRTIQRPAWWGDGPAIPASEIFVDPALRPQVGEPFFVPIVFTHEVVMGEKHVAGFATLPGGRCADFPSLPRVSPLGAVVVGRLRNPTTVAHELGHYLGLCHTFQTDPPAVSVASDDKGDAGGGCGECIRTGDGVCDTPFDPGVEGCKVDPVSCAAACRDNATPDVFNLMSYFGCRRYFSTEQARYMRRYLHLRREEREGRASGSAR